MAAYCSLDDVKEYESITESGDDEILQDLINRTSLALDQHCKRTVCTATDTTRYFTVGVDTDGYMLFFDDVIASVTTVLNGDASSTEITSSEYVLRERNQPPYYGLKILSSKGKVWEYADDPEDAIQVTGKWAYYAATTLPDDVPANVKQAVIRWVAYRYRQRDTSIDIDRPMITDAGVTILPGRMPHDVAKDVAYMVRRGA
jgi:hypothetical protein